MTLTFVIKLSSRFKHALGQQSSHDVPSRNPCNFDFPTWRSSINQSILNNINYFVPVDRKKQNSFVIQ